MSIIRKRIEVIGAKDGKVTRKELNALFDSGATHSFIRKDIADELAEMSPVPEIYSEFRGATDKATIKVEGFVPLFAKIKDCVIGGGFMVVKDLKEDMVIGADILQTHKLKIDMAKEDIDTSTCEPYHF